MSAHAPSSLLRPAHPAALLALVALALSACDAPEAAPAGDDAKGADTAVDTASADTAPADTDTGAPPDSGNDTGSDSPADSAADTAVEDPGPAPVRFVALGDAGEGNAEQYAVGAAIGAVCARDGCDFALYLGDNFYDSGVDAVDDAQFQEKFELPYADLDFPFYVTLGNHDYGGEGIGWELWKGETYVDYSAYSDKWTFPDLYYSHVQGDATFFGLDTTQVFWGITEDQLAWLQDGVAAANTGWTIAYGHHPYVSNGPHGNAGEYEGLDWVPIVNGESVKEFVDDGICGVVDVYICGHDHSLQWPESVCGTEFIVSGAGAKTTELGGDNPTWFESDGEGFVWIELDGETFTGVFYDQDGTELYRRSFTR